MKGDQVFSHNRFRFKTFSEQIAQIKIDVFHKIGKDENLSSTSKESYFLAALRKWKELNCTLDFYNFSSSITSLVLDLSHVVYNQDHITRILCQHLKVQNSLCLDALLDLVAQFARDLQHDFFPHFLEFFDVIAKLLDVNDAEVIECIFCCIAHVFKFSWRSMLNRFEDVYRLYKILLTCQEKSYVSQFAAENMAYLVRKAKNKYAVLEVVFKSVKDDRQLVEGIGCLLFEAVKGANYTFHSCTEDIIKVCFDKLAEGNDCQIYDCIAQLFKKSTKYATAGKRHTLMHFLVVQIMFETTNWKCQQLEETGNITHDKLENLLKLGQILTESKSNAMLEGVDELFKVIEELLQLDTLPEFADTLLGLIGTLLEHDLSDENEDYMHCIIQHIFKISIPLHKIAVFLHSIRNKVETSSRISQFCIDFIESNLLEEKDCTSVRVLDLLQILCQLILQKNGGGNEIFNSSVNSHQLIYFRRASGGNEMTNIKYQTVADFILETLNQSIDKFIESEHHLHYSNLILSCFICLPFSRPIDADKVFNHLQKSIQRLLILLKKTPSKSQSLLFLISEAFKSWLLVKEAQDESKDLELTYEEMIFVVREYPTNVHALIAFNIYCTVCSKRYAQCSWNKLEPIYTRLKENLSSGSSVIRRLSLRILTYYKMPTTFNPSHTVMNHECNDVIQTCLKAEGVPATFDRYQERVMLLRRLSYEFFQEPTFCQLCNDIVLRYLIGNLHINLRPLWDPVIDVLKTHANDQNKEPFWIVFSERLNFVVKNSESFNNRESEEKLDLNNLVSTLCNESVKRYATLSASCGIKEKPKRETVCLLMCRAMEHFSEIVQMKSHDVAPLFLDISRTLTENHYLRLCKAKVDDSSISADEGNDLEPGDDDLNRDENFEPMQRIELVSAFLKVFSFCKSPRDMHMQDEIYDVYLRLLCHRNSEIQQLAFKCLKMYQFSYLLPYEDHFEKLLDDNTFKDELLFFANGGQSDTIKKEHRYDALRIVIRLLFGKLQRRTGFGASGKKGRIARRNIITGFLASCQDQEMLIFLDIITERLNKFAEGCVEKSEATLEKIVPLRKQIGFLKMLETIFIHLGNAIKPHIDYLFRILIGILDTCAYCLEMRDKIFPHYIGQLKSIRQLSLLRLAEVFDLYPEYDFSLHTNSVLRCAVFPQIRQLKQESLEHPSPLLKLVHCWSKSPRFFPFFDAQYFHTSDESLLFHVFSILAISQKSEAVTMMVLSIAENIFQWRLNNSEKDSSAVENQSCELIGNNLDVILTHLQSSITQRKFKKHKWKGRNGLLQIELDLLAHISGFVKEPRYCHKIIGILFPILTHLVNEKDRLNTLITMKNLLCNCKSTVVDDDYLPMLFVSMKDRAVRESLCDLVETLAEEDPSLSLVSSYIRDLNSWDRRKVDEPDYERRLQAFTGFSKMLHRTQPPCKSIKLLLSNCIHFSLESQDISIRDSALSCVEHVVDFVQRNMNLFSEIIQGTIMPHIKSAMQSKTEIIRTEYVKILALIIRKFDHSTVSDMKSLTSENADNDFFENIVHIQIHRRIRAVRLLSQHATDGKLNISSLYYFLLPLVSHHIFDHDSEKDHNVVSETIRAIQSIVKCMPWNKYNHILQSYLRLMPKNILKEKTVIRIITAILDAFHFNLSAMKTNSEENEKVLTCKEIKKRKKTTKLENQSENISGNEMAEVTKIYDSISSKILPLLYKSLVKKSVTHGFHRKNLNRHNDEQDRIRLPIALAVVKLLQILPDESLHDYLTGIILRVCDALKSRERDMRESARTTLVSIAATLGCSYLPFVIKEMKSVLKRGYQMDVLCHTLKDLLNEFSEKLRPNDLNECLSDILEVIVSNVFNETTDEKEAEGIRRKIHEATSSNGYDCFEIISKFASQSSFQRMVSAVQKFLETTQNHRVISKVKEVLRRISVGLRKNSFLSMFDLLSCVQLCFEATPLSGTIKRDTNREDVRKLENDIFLIRSETARAQGTSDSRKAASFHILTAFGLQVLLAALKNFDATKLTRNELLVLDTFVGKLSSHLKCKFNEVVVLSTKLLTLMVSWPLPSLSSNMHALVLSLFDILKKCSVMTIGGDESRDIVVSSFKVFAVILRDEKKYKFTDEQIKILLMYAEDNILHAAQQSAGFSLLKAIISKRKNFSEIGDLIEKICQLSITSESQTSQLQSRQVLLQYLLDYPIGKKLEGFIGFFIQHLEYEAENGRLSALEMLALIVKYLPQESLQKLALYVFPPLASRLVNDESALCRKLTDVVLKTLLEKLHAEERSRLYDLAFTWLQQQKVALQLLSVQSIGIFAEVEKSSFEKRLFDLLPLISNIMDSKFSEDTNAMEINDLSDQLLFNILNTLKKIFSCCNVLKCSRFQMELTRIWANIEKCLQHPHVWIQLAACQMYGHLFASWKPEELLQISDKDKPASNYIGQILPVRITALFTDFCKQLRIGNIGSEFCEQITKNLIYLAKLVNCMGEMLEEEQTSDLSQTIDQSPSLKWLLRKMIYVASYEASQSQSTCYRRTCVFHWLAAISLDLGSVRIKPFLTDILKPLHREMNHAESKDSEIKKLAGEVLNVVREMVGREVFSATYVKLRKVVSEKKEFRKRKRIEEAINDQTSFARKKMKRSFAKRFQRKKL